MARTKYTVTFPAAKAGDRVTVDQDVYLESDSRNVTRRLDLNESLQAVFYSDAASVTASWKPRGSGTAVTQTVTTGTPTKTTGGLPNDWQPNTPYLAGTMVVYNTALYRAKTDFTSGVTFSASNWEAIGSAAYAPLYRTMRRRSKRQLLSLSPLAPAIAWSADSGASPLGASAVTIAHNSTRISYRGLASPLDNATFNFRQNGINAGGSPTIFAPEFDYHGSDFVVKFRSFDTTGGTWWLFIDDQPTTAAPFNPPASLGVTIGGVYRMRVTIPTGIDLRRIRVEVDNGQWRGLEIKPADSVIPTPDPGVKTVVLGDSFVGGALGVSQHTVFTATIGRILGWEMFNAGQGGTAYAHAGAAGSAAYTDAARIAGVAAADPDFVIVFGTVNNDSTANSATVGTAATSVYSQLATAAPRAKLFVVGAPPISAMPAQRISDNAAIKTAALAASNILAYIDPYLGQWWAADGRSGGSGQPWVYGTGWSTSTTGDGNADRLVGSDDVHPTAAGHDNFAYHIADRVAEILGGWAA